MRLYKPTIDDMLNSNEYQDFISDRLGNDLFIDDPERADRLHEYAADGCDGSTHAEVLDDWRAFVNCCSLPERCKDQLTKEIDACETWHVANGSIDSIMN